MTNENSKEKSLNENLELECFKKLDENNRKLFPKITERESPNALLETREDYVAFRLIDLELEKIALEKTIIEKTKVIKAKFKPEDQWFWEMIVDYCEGNDLSHTKKQIVNLEHVLSLLQKNYGEIPELSARITAEMIKTAELKPIYDVVNPIVKLKECGKDYTGLCPFHLQKTASFFLYPETNSFYCFGCGKGGNVIAFVMEYYGLSYKEAVKHLNNF